MRLAGNQAVFRGRSKHGIEQREIVVHVLFKQHQVGLETETAVAASVGDPEFDIEQLMRCGTQQTSGTGRKKVFKGNRQAGRRIIVQDQPIKGEWTGGYQRPMRDQDVGIGINAWTECRGIVIQQHYARPQPLIQVWTTDHHVQIYVCDRSHKDYRGIGQAELDAAPVCWSTFRSQIT